MREELNEAYARGFYIKQGNVYILEESIVPPPDYLPKAFKLEKTFSRNYKHSGIKLVMTRTEPRNAVITALFPIESRKNCFTGDFRYNKYSTIILKQSDCQNLITVYCYLLKMPRVKLSSNLDAIGI